MKSIVHSVLAATLAALLSAPTAFAGNPSTDDASARPVPAVAARAMTTPTATGEAGSAVFVLDPAGNGGRIVGTAALGGLEVYDLAGKRVGGAAGGETAAVTVGYGLAIDGAPVTLLAAVDTTDNRLRIYRLAGDALSEVSAGPLLLGFAGEGLCSWRNPLDGSLNLFIVGDGGEIEQRQLHVTVDGRVDARQVRRIGVPSTLKQCVVARDGQAYAAEEAVGIWRFSADPEADIAATLVDSPRSGRIAEEIGGLAIVDGGDGHEWLLASDANGGRINVYDRGDDDAYLGSFAPTAPGSDEALEEPGPLHAVTSAAGAGFESGLLLVADEEAEDGANYKLLAVADIVAALRLPAGGATDPRAVAAAPVPAVTPVHETDPVRSYGDAADDPAIWAHPTDPARSLIVATDKKAGLALFDLQGHEVQFLADGKMNNVDLRDGFRLGGRDVTLVAASNRTDKTIALYVLDGPGRTLTAVADGPQATGLEDPYGLCMYRSARSGKTYVFINSGDGPLNQWELVDAGHGKVRANLVRELRFETQTEGCVADDAAGLLFIGEEDIALWKLAAEPDGGDAMTAVDRVADNDRIKDDLEGVGLYDLGGGRGYLVVSSQGNDTYAVYRREGAQEYLGSFAVASDGARGIDGISETDGLDVSSANLGPGFEHGALVAQDGRNVLPVQNQNYKIVPWTAIAEALHLELRK